MANLCRRSSKRGKLDHGERPRISLRSARRRLYREVVQFGEVRSRVGPRAHIGLADSRGVKVNSIFNCSISGARSFCVTSVRRSRAQGAEGRQSPAPAHHQLRDVQFFARSSASTLKDPRWLNTATQASSATRSPIVPTPCRYGSRHTPAAGPKKPGIRTSIPTASSLEGVRGGKRHPLARALPPMPRGRTRNPAAGRQALRHLKGGGMDRKSLRGGAAGRPGATDEDVKSMASLIRAKSGSP